MDNRTFTLIKSIRNEYPIRILIICADILTEKRMIENWLIDKNLTYQDDWNWWIDPSTDQPRLIFGFKPNISKEFLIEFKMIWEQH